MILLCRMIVSIEVALQQSHHFTMQNNIIDPEIAYMKNVLCMLIDMGNDCVKNRINEAVIEQSVYCTTYCGLSLINVQLNLGPQKQISTKCNTVKPRNEKT